MRKLCLLFGFGLGNFLSSAQLQPSPLTISGFLVDSMQAPVSNATIRFLYKSNTYILMKADEMGGFQVTSDSARVDLLHITATGYQEKWLPLVWDSLPPQSLELGKIFLTPTFNQLDTVFIPAQKTVLQRQADRIVYHVANDAESPALSVLDMMRKIPYLSLDGQRNLLYKGGSDYKVFINGRPSGLLANNPSEVLRNMPATTVERIEVITYPSAKYDAAGIAGIINLITLKKIPDSYAGSANLKTVFPEGNVPELGLSFTTRRKKWGVHVFAGLNRELHPSTHSQRRRMAPGQSLTETIRRESKRLGGYWGSEWSYEIDSLQLLFAQLNFNGSRSNTRFQQSTHMESSLAQTGFGLENTNRNQLKNVDLALQYQLGFKKDKSKILTTSYKLWQNTSSNKAIGQFYQIFNYDGANFQQQNQGVHSEHTIQIDYGQAIKPLTLEAGIKTIFRYDNNHYGYSKWDADIGSFYPDKENTRNFKNQQKIVSAYNTWQYAIKSWFFRLGIRAEQTYTQAGFQNGNIQVQQKYLNWVPNILMSKSWSPTHSLSAGFSQRLRRPGINKLNPFIDRSNPTIERTGNPYLEASIMNTFKADYGFSKKGTLNIGVDFSYGRHMELRVMTLNSATGVMHISFGNLGKISGLGLHYFGNYPLSQKWKMSFNGNLIQFSGTARIGTKIMKLNRRVSRNTLALSYLLAEKWQLNGSLFVVSRNITDLQATTNGFVGSSFNISRNIWSKKLTLTAFADNPFQKFRNTIITTIGDNFSDWVLEKEYFQRIGCSIGFKFGGKNVSIKKTKQTIQNSDLSN